MGCGCGCGGGGIRCGISGCCAARAGGSGGMFGGGWLEYSGRLLMMELMLELLGKRFWLEYAGG